MKRNLLSVAAILLLSAGCASEATAPVTPDSLSHINSGAAVSSLLVDTGPGGTTSVGSLGLFASGSTTCAPQPACAANAQFLGGKFTLASDATIDGVQGWMQTSAGSMDVFIRADNAGTPGTSVHTQNYSVTAQAVFGWKAFDNFNVSLPAGTYWVTFEPVANGGITASMNGTAAAPLARYAFFSPPNVNWGTFATPALGFRVSGSVDVVSTPSQKIADLRTLIAGFGLQKGIANAADSKLQSALAAIGANNTPLACYYLQNEIDFANAQSGKKISTADAASIVSAVGDIRTQLGC